MSNISPRKFEKRRKKIEELIDNALSATNKIMELNFRPEELNSIALKSGSEEERIKRKRM